MIKIPILKKEEIELSEEEARLIAMLFLKKHFSWSEDYFIEDGWVCARETLHTTHAFEANRKVRQMSPKDNALYLIFKELQKNGH